MITQLEIKNFRGFSEYKIEDVGQVNLLVGTNNCGKTSVLQAIRLLKSRGDSSILYSLIPETEESVLNEQRMHSDAERDLCQLFHGFRLIPKFNMVIVAADHAIESLSFSINEIQISSFKRFPKFAGQYQLDAEWRWDQDKYCKRAYPISGTGGLIDSYIREASHAKPSIVPDDNSVKFVPAFSLDQQEDVALLDKVLLTPDEELILEVVRIIEPDIIRFASLSSGKIIVKSSKWEERIPIGSFGDGIWRLLGLILSLVAAKNGTLLIDEIDTGLHHTVMSKMWKLICTTARKLNVQVFATTHSSDCWKTLADNAVEDEFADMPIRIHRINKDKESAVTFTNREMHLALNRELEVR